MRDEGRQKTEDRRQESEGKNLIFILLTYLFLTPDSSPMPFNFKLQTSDFILRTPDSCHPSSFILHPLFYRCYDDFAEVNLAVVTLEHDRAGILFVAVEGAAGDSVDHNVIVHFLVIKEDGQSVADDRRFHHLPLSGGQACVDERFDAAVERHVAVIPGFFACVIEDLQLIPPAEVDATVASLIEFILTADFEILELMFRDQIVGFGLVGHDTVHNTPSRRTVFVLDIPAIHRFPIEEENGCAEFVFSVRVELTPLRWPNADPADLLLPQG